MQGMTLAVSRREFCITNSKAAGGLSIAATASEANAEGGHNDSLHWTVELMAKSIQAGVECNELSKIAT